ncbi:MAG: hypothetical protein WCA17_03420 [Burkholderiales bacterium]
MNRHSAFELEVLGWVANDYEAPHTIAGDIARETGRLTTECEVRAALLALAQSGMVQAYAYDARANCYKPITHSEAASTDDPWFMSTAAGNAELERDAN